MPVVIHDFEVVSEPPPRPAAGATPAAQSPASESQKASSLLRALLRQQERLARLRAH
jgi:hypothetical protein